MCHFFVACVGSSKKNDLTKNMRSKTSATRCCLAGKTSLHPSTARSTLCGWSRYRSFASQTTTQTMKGVQISSFGDSSVLEYREDIPVPKLASTSDVLVKVSHSSINQMDVSIRNGYGKTLLPMKRETPFPIILGFDVVGTVISVGSDVWNVKVGDKVWGATDPFKQGCQAEIASVNEHYVCKPPSNLSDAEAASIPYVGLTSWRALVETAGLDRASQKRKVFVNGGSGGVGFFSLQLLKYFGHEVVTTCGTENVSKVLKVVGSADRVIDYTSANFDQVLEDDFDVVLDAVGGENMEERCCSILRKGGHYLGLQGPLVHRTDQQGFALGLLQGVAEIASKKAKHAVGINAVTRLNSKGKSVSFDYILYRPHAQNLSRIAELVEKGAIQPDVDKVFQLKELKEAHDYFERAKGKVVIQI